MVEIYSPYPSARLKYTLEYIFTERLGLTFKIIHSPAEAKDSPALLVNYSRDQVPGALQILPQALLFETDIHYLPFDLENAGDAELPFHKEDRQLGFDLFAATFFLISRYEEYLLTGKDQHQRFIHSNSSQARGKCLDLPLVDIWLANFRTLLVNEFGLDPLQLKPEAFEISPSIDVDSVFAYKGRTTARHIAAGIKDILLLRIPEISGRLSVLANRKKDPNDNFDLQLQLLQDAGLRATYFFQVGPYGRYDKNIHHSNPRFRDIILKVKKAGHKIGLHPSYSSNSEAEKIRAEKHILEGILGEPVYMSRQHFLRFNLPFTYRTLLDCGISEEYSMGYSETTGFRAGTAFPFYWFDLEKNEPTNLRIFPFSMMDVAYRHFRGLSARDTISSSEVIIRKLRELDAPFCFVFHNESLSEHRGWQGWTHVFKQWLHG